MKKRSRWERFWCSPQNDADKIKNAWSVAYAIGILSLAVAVLSVFWDFLTTFTNPAMIPFALVLIGLAYWGDKHKSFTILVGFLATVIIDFILVIVFVLADPTSGIIGGLVVKALFAYWLYQGAVAFKRRGSPVPGILLGIGLELLALALGVAWVLAA